MAQFQHPGALREAQHRIQQALEHGASSLDLSGLRLRRLPEDIAKLAPQLTALDLSNCRELRSLDGIETLTGLTELKLRFCRRLETLEPLSPLVEIKWLNIELCDQLTSLKGLERLNQLEVLGADHCTCLSNITALKGKPALKNISLERTRVSDISPVSESVNLCSLNLSGCLKVKSLEPLNGLANLSNLNVRDIKQSIDGITALPSLKSLQVSGLVENIDVIVQMQQLETLRLSGANDVFISTALAKLRRLKSLTLFQFNTADLNFLQGSPQLEELRLLGCTELSDLSGLRRVEQLKSLVLSFRENVVSLQSLASLQQLESLSVHAWEPMRDVSVVSKLSKLKTLSLNNFGMELTLNPADLPASLEALHGFSFETQKPSLDNIAHLTSLQEVSTHFRLTECQMDALKSLPQMMSIRSDCTWTKDTGVWKLTGLQCQENLSVSELDDLYVFDRLTVQALSFSENSKLQDLTTLGNYKNLNSLSISGCHGLKDYSPLMHVSTLETLQIGIPPYSNSTLQIHQIPKLDWGTAEYLLNELPKLDLAGQILIEHIPPELTCPIKQSAIEDWYWDIQRHGHATPTALKVMILGNGQIGKTQLARRLRGEAFDESVKSTHGIQLHRFDYNEIEIQCWDFGGQDVYLGTHSLFIDSRALYLLLWHPLTENNDLVPCEQIEIRNRPLSYWLAYLKSLAGSEAQVMVCQSQCDDPEQDLRAPVPHPVPFTKLREVPISAKVPGGLDEFTPFFERAVQLQLKRNGDIWLPKNWLAVEQEIALLQTQLLPYDAYQTLCVRYDVAAPETLVQYLHQTGRVFYRKGCFDDQLILDQAWALQGVYLLLEREHVMPALKGANGCFAKADLEPLLWQGKEFTASEKALFVEMMLQCGVCFKLTDDSYIAPDALPEKAERQGHFTSIWQQGECDYHIRLEYAFLHDATMRYLLSKIGQQAGPQACYWRYGCCYYDAKANARVWFECTPLSDEQKGERDDFSNYGQPGVIDIRVAGKQGLELAKHLLKSITREQHLEQSARVEWRVGEPTEEAREIQDEDTPLAPFAGINPAAKASTGLYFSYARGKAPDPHQQICDEIYTQLAKYELEVIRDREATGYGDSIAEFEREIGRADAVLLVISRKSLYESTHCMNELKLIYEHCQGQQSKFNDKVFPVILADVHIDSLQSRLEIVQHWKHEKEKINALIDAVGKEDAGPEAVAELKAMSAFIGCINSALSWVSDRVTERESELQADATVQFVVDKLNLRLRNKGQYDGKDPTGDTTGFTRHSSVV
ncbi:COR domain-containing protein [Pseudoalteromonas sp. R3]|uniref:COR domain-containing protein n=1 Tax=Pseudoalteromonas sp. R3 TaxID=1709477 RepID=UPI0006B4D3DF|nr:COR domain-containing protein [Pseudoalteromonas sp. R3]AZZ99251.1 TIR domain-containing protein [Pseudoalteromonas sp. R3]